jgi:uncharacterized protein (DUF2252 family)
MLKPRRLDQPRDVILRSDMRFATLAERKATGKALRQQTPRASQAVFVPWTDRPNPIALLEQQNTTRVPGLIPIRWGRMSESPFAFMRGSALVMATDLAKTPNTGIEVVACGDCHLLNFGMYATPERGLIFDTNDFDETQWAPWEWDVKRLAASFEVAGRYLGFPARVRSDVVKAMSESYRSHLAEFAEMTTLEVWYFRLEPDVIVKRFMGGVKKRMAVHVRAAESSTQVSSFTKLTEVVDGQRRFVEDPPKVFRAARSTGGELLNELFNKYLRTLRADHRVLLNRYKAVDAAFKVVGVGSVGTRCGMILMMADEGDPLILQIKEANRSVLETYAGPIRFQNQGERVVTGQRIMQAASDMFLGWTSAKGRDYYVRQLKDMKWGVDLADAKPRGLEIYARVCGATIAHGHARSLDPAVLSGYLGSKDTFDIAMAEFAVSYADQVERDFKVLTAAIKAKKVKAAQGGAKQLALATQRALADTRKAFE